MNIDKAVELLDLLSDKSRLVIIKALLKQRKMNGSELLKLINCGQPTLSHHMSVMNEAGLVKSNKKGNKVFYSINEDTYIPLLNFLSKNVEAETPKIIIPKIKPIKEDIGIVKTVSEKEKPKKQKEDVPVYLL